MFEGVFKLNKGHEYQSALGKVRQVSVCRRGHNYYIFVDAKYKRRHYLSLPFPMICRNKHDVVQFDFVYLSQM